MNYLTPLSFALAILLPVIIAMYLLKLRRTEQVVSSTYLWQRMVRDVEANAPWQRLRRNLLLLLQLLFLIALIFALARPFTWAEGSNGAASILIVDVSASMAATDVAPNRLENAKEQARLIVSNLPEGARTTLIAAGENAQVLVSSSSDRRQILQAIESLSAQPGGSDLTSALELASAIAARQVDTEIVVLSDGRVTLPETLALSGRLRYLPVGESGANQAISLLTLESSPAGDSLTAFVQISNYAEITATRRLMLNADGRLIDAHDLVIPPQGQVSVISSIVPTDTQVLEAAFSDADALALDDRAWTVQRGSGNQNIALVSAGNRFIETVLNLLPGIEPSVVNLDNWQSGGAQAKLTIFDSFVPTDTLPGGNLLFIGPLASSSVFTITGSLELPLAQPADGDQALLENVDLSQVSIFDSARIPLPAWARPVIVDDFSGSPLLFAGEIAGRRIAVMAFDPRHSDLPLQPAFPILIANLVEWLLPGRMGDIPPQINPGEVLTFTPPPEVESLRITSPDGTNTQLEIREGRAVFGETRKLGVYALNWPEGNLKFAVNLSNPQESDIAPTETLSLLSNSGDTETGQSQQARRELWRPLTASALLLITAEWLVYQRATISKLWHELTNKLKRKS